MIERTPFAPQKETEKLFSYQDSAWFEVQIGCCLPIGVWISEGDLTNSGDSTDRTAAGREFAKTLDSPGGRNRLNLLRIVFLGGGHAIPTFF